MGSLTVVGRVMTSAGNDLDGIRSRLAAATPGQWKRTGPWQPCEPKLLKLPDQYSSVAHADGNIADIWPWTDHVANAEFIAHAPEDVAYLLALVDRYRDVIAALEAETAATRPNDEPDPEPVFESLPSALDITHWYTEEMRGVPNVGGDAWWLCRESHSSARMLAFVDYDDQEYYLLDIATGDTRDLLWVTCGVDGLACQWWHHPVGTTDSDPAWYHKGIEWMAEQIVVHCENLGWTTWVKRLGGISPEPWTLGARHE